MPLYPTSFFIPPAGVPFIVEDKYVRGGYRVLATVTDRDAIAVAGRKAGMLVHTQDDHNIWELVGGTTNASWTLFDPTKYIKLGAPLIVTDGKVTLDLSSMFDVDGNGKLTINMTDLLGPAFSQFFSATATDDQKVLTYNHTTTSFILKTISAGSSYSAAAGNAVEINGSNVISLNIQTLMETSLVAYYNAVAADNGKVLAYDHASTSFKLITPAAGGTTLARAELSSAQGSVAAGAVKDFTFTTGKTAMLLELDLSVPDVTVECHSTAARNDANPYKFKSAAGKLFDDGISVLEDSSLQYNRRYAFIANLEATPANTSYWRITNNSASAQTITVNITYIKFE